MGKAKPSKDRIKLPLQFELIPGLAPQTKAKPFLKWAGGKKQLLPELARRVPKKFGRYYEPFVGGGALFFHLQPKQAFLSDIVPDLVATYEVIRDDLESLIRDLKKHSHTEQYFYEIRNVDRKPSFKRWGKRRRASRLMYLNKTCYNGLYRVNSMGQFNVPFGAYKNPKWLDEENLRACSRVLQNTDIQLLPFEQISRKIRKGDFVYFDPPYAPLNATSNFTGYSRNGFNGDDQIRLRDLCRRLDHRGIRFMLSNSAAPFIQELYSEFQISRVQASRAINSKGNMRGKVSELLVTNY